MTLIYIYFFTFQKFHENEVETAERRIKSRRQERSQINKRSLNTQADVPFMSHSWQRASQFP